ncbi:META domain-containing protein [Pseudonocardia endophytica]|uniref:Heat shock protein HslJ n=1 Tax=Pseudonocardia endophytica TaxID=401976 RepID=A0A4R1HH59_PSEEN|nr:META domain-containing protein [Pseudonocardia endophytica]TCK21537.1 heat shock protein HslJ [Pseudonocardia endophytica]
MTGVVNTAGGVQAAPMNPLQDRTFVTDMTMEDDVARPVVDGTRIRLTFRAGRLDANAGCNAVGFPLTVEPGRLRTGESISTLMFCGEERMAQETWLTTFLDADPEWSLSANGLLLRSGHEWMELTEEIGEPRPLWDRRFRSVSVTGTPQPLVPGTSILLTFTEAGSLVVEAGCNTMTFPYTTGGDAALIVGNPSGATEMACSPERMDQDGWIARWLPEEPFDGLRVVGNTMTLTRRDAELVLTEEPAQDTVPGVPEPTSSPEAPGGKPILENRRFRSVEVTENGAPRPLVEGTVIDLTLFSDSLSANAGCNTMGASLTVTADRLVVGPVASTLMFCGPELTGQDQWLAGFLGSGPQWSDPSAGLRLTSGTTTIVFTEVGLGFGIEPTELWGTTFDSVSVSEKGIVPAPVVPGTTITLTFTAPDRLTARAGCNTLGFRVVAGTDRLTVDDDFSSTRMACTPELTAQDEWLAKVLTDDPEYVFTGKALTLTRGSTSIDLAPRMGNREG